MAKLDQMILNAAFAALESSTEDGWFHEEGGINYEVTVPLQPESEGTLEGVLCATPNDPVTGDPDESRARFFRLSLVEVPKP